MKVQISQMFGDIKAESFKSWSKKHKECYLKTWTDGDFKFTHCKDHNDLYMRKSKLKGAKQ